MALCDRYRRSRMSQLFFDLFLAFVAVLTLVVGLNLGKERRSYRNSFVSALRNPQARQSCGQRASGLVANSGYGESAGA